MSDLLAQCVWPEIDSRYDRALREAVGFIFSRFAPLGIIASGTIIRGTPDPSSDLDICVIHQPMFRQRLQRFFNDVSTEIFVNPVAAIERCFDQERAAQRPCLAHMSRRGR